MYQNQSPKETTPIQNTEAELLEKLAQLPPEGGQIGPYEIKEGKYHRGSELLINGGWVRIHVTVRNDYSVRNRRQFLLSLNAAILSKLDFNHYSYIHHWEHYPDPYRVDSFTKMLSTKQAILLDSEEAKIRYWIRGFRTQAGMTQIQLSKLLGVSNGYLSKVEKGRRPISRQLASRILEWQKKTPG